MTVKVKSETDRAKTDTEERERQRLVNAEGTSALHTISSPGHGFRQGRPLPAHTAGSEVQIAPASQLPSPLASSNHTGRYTFTFISLTSTPPRVTVKVSVSECGHT